MNPGDYIKIILDKGEEKGILLESHEPGIYLLKLDSGYNIGIKKQDIRDIRVIKKRKQKKEKEEKKTRKDLPTIAFIVTGGTISAKLDAETGGVSWLTSEQDLLDLAPEIKDLANLQIEKPFMKASEEMSGKDWKIIAKLCEKLLNNNNIKGIIITQGTDFLHYTSAALSFMLGKLNKPVILTYAQRSTDRASTDASLNLVCAVKAALSDIAEVLLVGHANLDDEFCYAMQGTKVRKIHTSRRDAFKPINTQPIAKISKEKIETISSYNKRNKNKVKAQIKFSDEVALIKFYPDQDPNILDYYKEKAYKGIIIEASGLGHVNREWISKIKQLKNLIICITSQTIFGRVDPYVYSPARQLLGAGAIYLKDMLSETALIKLSFLLAKEKSKEKIKQLMLTNLANEFNPKLGDEFII